MASVGRLFGMPWEARVAHEVAARGGELLYLKGAMYPVLEVTVRIREKSREQLGSLEEAVLGMLAIAPMSLRQLGFGLGMPEHQTSSLIEEIVARGLATCDRSQPSAERYRLETLGKLSIEEGAIVLESDCSLRLCGITGRPLPSGLYERTFVLPGDLRSDDTSREGADKGNVNRKFAGCVILESHDISLQYLDITKIEDLRSVNLPAETLQISGVLSDSGKPGYLHGTIVCYRTQSHGRQWEIQSGREVVDWLDERDAIGMIEPLGSSISLSKEGCLSLIRDQLEELGFKASDASLSEFGNPMVTLSDCDRSLFRVGGGRRPLGFYVGTRTLPPIPLTTFIVDVPGDGGKFRRTDVLSGRGLMIRADAGSKLETDVDTFRRFSEAMASVEREYLSKRSRDLDLEKRAQDALHAAGLDTTAVRRALTLAKLGGLQEVLASIEDQTEHRGSRAGAVTSDPAP